VTRKWNKFSHNFDEKVAKNATPKHQILKPKHLHKNTFETLK